MADSNIINNVQRMISKSLYKHGNTFDNFIKEFELINDGNATNMQELKDKYNKKKQ